MSNLNKRTNSSNEIQQVPVFHKDIKKYCKQLTPQHLADAENRWLERICTEKPILQDQIPLILLSLEAKPFFYARLLEICRCLEGVMHQNFSGCNIEVRPFGSTATNLAFKDSDLDVFLDFHGKFPGPLDKLPQILKAIISDQRKVFKRVLLIEAKVPIVRCLHHSGISCDISFSLPLGVLNSELISFLMALDDRLRPFFMILKFWIKKNDINGPHALTSYALILMAIFYLQQLEKPILPPIVRLQNASPTPQIIGDWDASFVKDFSIFRNENRQSILQLLKGFFEFYATFEFGLYVISPFLGEKLLKSLFYHEEALPSDFKLYSENCRKDPKHRFEQVKFLCVQDPFNHGHNVTRNAQKKILLNFQDFCATASQICEEEITKAQKPGNGCEFFKHLFRPINEKSKKRRKLMTNGFEVLLCRDLVMQDGVGHSEEDLRYSWCEAVMSYFSEILTRVMKCQIENGQALTNGCSPGSEGEKIKELRCTMPYNLLQAKRRQTARQEFEFPNELSTLEKEEMISEYICDTHLKEEPKMNLKFGIHCYLKKSPTRILFEMEIFEEVPARKNILNEVYYSVENHVSKWIATYFENLTSRLP